LTIDTFSLAAWSAFATAVLVLVVLVVVSVAGGRLLRLQRRQADELTRIRQELAALREPEPGGPAMSRIGAEDRVFQVGDDVEVTDGPHRGDLGTIVESPDWLKPGYVCVELSRSKTRVYMAVSRLDPLRS
jgi:heme exporter protein D